MILIRDFSGREAGALPERNVEDAPERMRLELIDLFFGLLEDQPHPFPVRGEHLYRIIGQSLGSRPAVDPYGGFRHAAAEEITDVEWVRVYDLISRLWREYQRVGLDEQFVRGVNQILAGYGSAWELHPNGRLHRVLPVAAQRQVEAAFTELQAARYASALLLLNQANDAYSERPRRDRDACANVFDAMESVAKERYAMPHSSFGQVIHHLTQIGGGGFSEDTLTDLRALNALRNHHFGHGMLAPFDLSAAEVDFVYLSCIAVILLFTRTP